MTFALVPSRLVRPLVPQFVAARWGHHVDTGLDMADAIVAGRDERAQSLRTAFIAFTIRIVSAFIAFISQVLMARWLGTHEYGIFVWVWVAAIICGGLSCVGFPSAVVKFIPQYLVEDNQKALRGIILGSRIVVTLVARMIVEILFFATVGMWRLANGKPEAEVEKATPAEPKATSAKNDAPTPKDYY